VLGQVTTSGLSIGNNTEYAGRAGTRAAVTVSTITIGEIFPFAFGQEIAFFSQLEGHRAGIVRDQEVKTTKLFVDIGVVQHSDRNRNRLANKDSLDLFDRQLERYHSNFKAVRI